MTKRREKRSTKTRAGAPAPEQSSQTTVAEPHSRRLTPKQEAFVRAYLETGNASEAYRRAYSPKKMSTKDVSDEASRLLQHPGIAPVIAEARAQLAAKHGVTADRIIAELARIGFADIRKAIKFGPREMGESPEGQVKYTNDVCLIPSGELDDDTALAISEVSQTVAGLKIKFHDKLSALDKLGKNLGMFDNGETGGNVTVIVEKLAGTHAAPPPGFKKGGGRVGS